MKVAVIGAGYWGKKHVDEYKQIGADVTAVDPEEGSRKECKERFEVPTLSDYHDALNDDSFKAVSICTPNGTHYGLAREFISAGKHVLLEKPMTLDHEKANELISLAREKGVVLAVGHIYRFNNAVKKLKELVETGDLGDPYMLKMAWTFLEPVFPDRDILFDLAIHPFDIVNYIFEKSPENPFCLARGYRQENEEIAFINSTLGKMMVNFELSWLTPEKVRDLVLVGSKKTAFVKLVSQEITVRDNGTKEDRKLEVEESNVIREELEDFLSCIEKGREPVASGPVGAEMVRIVQSIKKM